MKAHCCCMDACLESTALDVLQVGSAAFRGTRQVCTRLGLCPSGWPSIARCQCYALLCVRSARVTLHVLPDERTVVSSSCLVEPRRFGLGLRGLRPLVTDDVPAVCFLEPLVVLNNALVQSEVERGL